MGEPKLLEKQIENLILSYLKSKRILAWKNESVGVYDQKKGIYRRKNNIHRKVGISDILGIFEGKLLAIEVKSAKGKASPSQLEFIDEVREHGGIAFIAKSIEDVEQALGLV